MISIIFYVAIAGMLFYAYRLLRLSKKRDEEFNKAFKTYCEEMEKKLKESNERIYKIYHN